MWRRSSSKTDGRGLSAHDEPTTSVPGADWLEDDGHGMRLGARWPPGTNHQRRDP